MSVGTVDKTTGNITKTAGNMADKVGDLTALHTTAKSDAVAAINEIADTVAAIDDGANIDSFADVESALSDKADTDMVAADFNAGSSYTAGNYCVQDGKLYKFKNNHSGAWASADVDEVKITGELSALKSGLTNLTNEIITPSQIAYHLGHVAINGEHDVLKTVTLAQGENLSNYDFIIVGNSYYDSGAATYGFAVVPTSVILSIYSFDSGLSYLCATSKTSVHVIYDATNNAFKFFADNTVPNGNYFFVGGVKLRTRS